MRNNPIWRWVIVAGLVVAIVAAVYWYRPNALLAQAPPAEETQAPAESPGIDAATEVEIQRRFNELRRELLDDRAASINWWLSGIALLLTVLAIVIAAGGYVGFRKFQDIEEEARRNVERARTYAENAKRLVEEIRKYGEEADEHLRGIADISSEFAQNITDADFGRDPGRVGASAIAEARLLAEEGKTGEAIARWRHIASVAEGSNDDLAALAYRSIGDLTEQRSRSARP